MNIWMPGLTLKHLDKLENKVPLANNHDLRGFTVFCWQDVI